MSMIETEVKVETVTKESVYNRFLKMAASPALQNQLFRNFVEGENSLTYNVDDKFYRMFFGDDGVDALIIGMITEKGESRKKFICIVHKERSFDEEGRRIIHSDGPFSRWVTEDVMFGDFESAKFGSTYDGDLNAECLKVLSEAETALVEYTERLVR